MGGGNLVLIHAVLVSVLAMVEYHAMRALAVIGIRIVPPRLSGPHDGVSRTCNGDRDGLHDRAAVAVIDGHVVELGEGLPRLQVIDRAVGDRERPPDGVAR